MNIFVYVLITLITVVVWYQKKFGHRNKLLSKFSAPPSFPILNHGILLLNKTPSQILDTLTELSLKYGPVWRFDISIFKSFIQIHEPKVVEEILSSQKLLVKSDEYDNLANWLGYGLLISSGNKWHQRRKIITPTFHFKILEEFVEIMEKHGIVFVNKLRKYEERKVDVFPLISLYALDVICGENNQF